MRVTGITNTIPRTGSGESGKSTVVKQMKIIHQGGYAKDELAMYRLTVYKNLLDCAKSLIGAMHQFNLDPEDPSNEELAEFLLSYNIGPDPNVIIDPRVGSAVAALWSDPAVPQVLDRQTEFYLMDSAP